VQSVNAPRFVRVGGASRLSWLREAAVRDEGSSLRKRELLELVAPMSRPFDFWLIGHCPAFTDQLLC
jgi:hypothetical protein